jgi:hypothetical protein
MFKPLPTHTTEEGIFKVIDLYIAEKSFVGNNVLIFAEMAHG